MDISEVIFLLAFSFFSLFLRITETAVNNANKKRGKKQSLAHLCQSPW